MLSKLQILLAFIVTLSVFSGKGQSCNVDSLLNRQRLTKSDSVSIMLNIQIGHCYSIDQSYDSALVYIEDALRLARDIDDKVKEAYALYELGEVYYNMEYGTEAILKLNEALAIQNGLPAELRIEAYNIMGVVYLRFEEYDKAVEYFDQALKEQPEASKRTGQSYEFLYNNKGILFGLMGMPDSSKANHYKCLSIRLKQEDKYGIGQSYNNLGSVFFEEEAYDSALFYFEKGYAWRLQVVPSYYSFLVESEINISKALVKLGKFAKAEKILNRLSAELDGKDNSDLSLRLNYEMMLLYEGKRSYQKAFAYSVSYYELKDSIYGIEKREELIRVNLNNKYLEKKKQDSLIAVEHQKIEKLAQAKEEQKAEIIQWGLIIALAFTVGIIVLVYRNYRSKKRASEEILAQKNEVVIQRDISEQQKLELQIVNQEITDSITYAKRIQQAILPSKGWMNSLLHEHFVLYLPKAIVAGDFYWVQELDDRVYFAAADCTGHGVPGAMVSVMCSNALNRSVEEYGLRLPGEILDKTSELVVDAFVNSGQEVKDGMDISLCCLNTETNEFSFSGANNPVYILKADASNTELECQLSNGKQCLIEVKGDKQAIGWHDNRKPFKTNVIELTKGDMVYSITDGFPDQFGGERGKKYKYKQLKMFLMTISQMSATDQHKALLNEFNNWKGELEQVDDVCVLGWRVP